MSNDITVHGHPNNTPGKRPRKPIVHLLAGGDCSDIQSIHFHPDDAAKVARAIRAAGRAAKAGRKFKAVEIELKPCD